MRASGVHVIAEAGTNHDGDVAKAVALIDAAHRAGADSVKFQIIYPESLYVEWLLQDGQRVENPVVAARRTQQLADDDWKFLAGHAASIGIGFSSSVFDVRGIELLRSLKVPYLKIASTDLNNDHMLLAAAASGIDLVVSTGMSNVDEIDHAIQVLEEAGALNRTTLMHCVSEYPCPEEHAGVDFLTTLQAMFPGAVGFSDHTEGVGAAVAAVALGAAVIEKHLTLDRTSEGFDHHYALEEDDFKRFVDALRQADRALSPKPAKLTEAESSVAARARRGVYARTRLPEGHVLSLDDLLIVRPPTKLRPNEAFEIIGRRCAVDIEPFEAVTREMFD